MRAVVYMLAGILYRFVEHYLEVHGIYGPGFDHGCDWCVRMLNTKFKVVRACQQTPVAVSMLETRIIVLMQKCVNNNRI